MNIAELYIIIKFAVMGSVLAVALIFKTYKDIISRAFIANAVLGILTTTLDETIVKHNLELGAIHDLITIYIFHFAFYKELKNHWHAMLAPALYTLFFIVAFSTDWYIPLFKSGDPIPSMYGGLNTHQYGDLEVILSILFIVSVFFWMWRLIASDNMSMTQVNKRLTFAFALLMMYSLKFYFDVLGTYIAFRMSRVEYQLVSHIVLFISFFTYNALVITGLLWDRRESISSPQPLSSSS